MMNAKERSFSSQEEKIYLTWDDYLHLIDKLSNMLNSIDFDFVFGIPRGGLIIATILSHTLNLPLLINPYTVSKRSKLLIVDDIIDTGKTIREYKEYFENCYIATLYKHKELEFHSDAHCYVELNDKWIVFPYEKD